MSVKVISLMSRKGGVGKSTLSVLIASSLHYRTKKRILLVDADPQFSVKNQREQEKEDAQGNLYDVEAFNWVKQHKGDVPMKRFLKFISKVENEYDIILMDTPGKMEGDEIPIIIGISDCIIVPIVGSAYDIQSTIDFLNIIPPIAEERRNEGEGDIEVFGLINKYDRSIEFQYLKDIEGTGNLKMFESYLSQRVRYKRENSTIKDFINETIEDEYNLFYNELIKNCKIK